MGRNCAPLLADIFLYSYEVEFIQSLLSAGKKRLASQFNFTYRYIIDDVSPLINQTLRIISVRCIPLSLRSKKRRRATRLLPTWICSCQSVGTVNFALPFTTNVTISISILQAFRFWVATFYLSPPMMFLSHNSPDTPALAPLMNVSFGARCDFSISLSGIDMSSNVWNRLLRKFFGRYGDLTKQYEIPLSRMLHDILDNDHVLWHTPLIRYYTNFWPLLILTLLQNLTFLHNCGRFP